MAKSARTRRVNSRSERYTGNTYEEGSAVRKLSELPVEEERRELPVKVSKKTQANRRRARQMGKGFVVFLTIVCAATVMVCVNFLQLKAQITTQNETVATLESKLSKLKADNDAYYNTAMASVSMDTVKDAALNRLGMTYADESQVYYYDVKGNSYVRQFTDVPAGK
ncbi:MAG: hypothetical protein PHG16_08720 [Lachnospiraceae bacterium]|nr:hypothetical protein [Lachnospiraceae bacterium]